MLRLHTQAPRQQKTPAAGWQTRERVGAELSSADTLSYDENGPCAHAVTIPPRNRNQFPVRRASCDPEGRSGDLVPRSLCLFTVRAAHAPTSRRSPSPKIGAGEAGVTGVLLDHHFQPGTGLLDRANQ